MVTKRIVVGAHYGLGSWLAQRMSAVFMALYCVIVAVVLVGGAPLTHGVLTDLFRQGWMRVATLLFVASYAVHAWVGLRDILMDYARPAGLRLALEVMAIVVIACYVGWTVQVLWR